MDRSLEMVIGLWAILKAGGAYVPLNTEDPEARLTEILEDCAPVAVLTQAHLQDRLGPGSPEVIVLPEGGDIASDTEAGNPGHAIGAGDLAYMIYTSGSTGKPKGVVIEHGAIHNRVVWMHEEYGLAPGDRVLQKTPYTFDVSVWEFLWPFAVRIDACCRNPGRPHVDQVSPARDQTDRRDASAFRALHAAPVFAGRGRSSRASDQEAVLFR